VELVVVSNAATLDRPIRSSRISVSRRLVLMTVACTAVAVGVGNLGILGLHVWASSGASAPHEMAGTHNFRMVDDKVWRGSRPSTAGYKALAKAGVTTIVDLRAEKNVSVPEGMLAARGVEIVRIPMRDGQAPTDQQVRSFLDAVRKAPGIVYVHCMAGVGRTGTMVAAYLVGMRDISPAAAWRHNLSVGPPSLEQMVFVSGIDEPNVFVTAISRVLDAPRRLLTYVK